MRKLYGGYGITEMRRMATEYQIPGRSKMDPDQLLAALHAYWDARRQASEVAYLAGGITFPGVTLVVMTNCGCVLRATSGVQEYDQAVFGDDRPKPLFIRAEMVTFCDRCKADHPAGVDYYNEAAERNAYRFMLYQLRQLPTDLPKPGQDHAFISSYSGMVCGAMVELLDGTGDQCGKTWDHPVHGFCGAPNPCLINRSCTKRAGHDAPDNDMETKLHSNGFSRWSCEDLARQADDDLTTDEIEKPTGVVKLHPTALAAAVDAVAPAVYFRPEDLAAVETRRQAQMAAARSYGLLGGVA